MYASDMQLCSWLGPELTTGQSIIFNYPDNATVTPPFHYRYTVCMYIASIVIVTSVIHTLLSLTFCCYTVFKITPVYLSKNRDTYNIIYICIIYYKHSYING